MSVCAVPDAPDPPSSKTGGNSGELVITTDYLTTTMPLPPGGVEDPRTGMRWMIHAATEGALGRSEDQSKGLFGYREAIRWPLCGAVMCWGGNRDTLMVSLPGSACSLVPTWGRLIKLWRDSFGARITRWDGAVDDYLGRWSVDVAADWWKKERWHRWGRPPACSQVGNWIRPDGKGRTFYVGNRKNGKLCRVYEKGKLEQDPSSPWTRWEVELHNVDRVIPWEVLLEPARYIAGAYPCLEWVKQGVEGERIRTVKKSGEIGMAALAGHCRASYGKLLNALGEAGMDDSAVVDSLIAPGLPARLEVAASIGALTPLAPRRNK